MHEKIHLLYLKESTKSRETVPMYIPSLNIFYIDPFVFKINLHAVVYPF